MEAWMIVLMVGGVVALFLLVGAPLKPIRFIGHVAIRMIVATLGLFLINSFAVFTGFFFPINVMTTVVVAFLGVPGVVLLAAIQHFILP